MSVSEFIGDPLRRTSQIRPKIAFLELLDYILGVKDSCICWRPLKTHITNSRRSSTANHFFFGLPRVRNRYKGSLSSHSYTFTRDLTIIGSSYRNIADFYINFKQVLRPYPVRLCLRKKFNEPPCIKPPGQNKTFMGLHAFQHTCTNIYIYSYVHT